MASNAHARKMASQAWAIGRDREPCWGRMVPWARSQYLRCRQRHTWLELRSWFCQSWRPERSAEALREYEFHWKTCRRNDQYGHAPNPHSYSYQEKAPQPAAIDIAVTTSSIIVATTVAATTAMASYPTQSIATSSPRLLYLPSNAGRWGRSTWPIANQQLVYPKLVHWLRWRHFCQKQANFASFTAAIAVTFASCLPAAAFGLGT